MPTETAQLLSTAHWINGSGCPAYYRPTHHCHPCTIWTARSTENYRWLYRYFELILEEYTARYHRQHLAGVKMLKPLKKIPNCPETEQTPFALAMPEQYKQADAVQAYRAYYLGEKLKFCKWTEPAQVPEWILNRPRA